MISGSIVALLTPMHPDSLEVDWDALKKLVDWHIEQGTNSIVAVGTTGESATLSVAEHAQVISVVVEQAAGRIPIIAGTGANSTSEAIELTQAAADAGADACLLVTPYYNKPTQEGLYLHYRAIAEAVDIDQILYNVPGRTACDMLPETVLRLSAIDNIVGIKEATGDLERAREIIQQCPEGFAVYSGDDATARELMLLGGHGDISVTANVAPKLMSEMCAAALSGDAGRAQQLDTKLEGLHSSLFVEANPIPVKWAVAELGLLANALRLPMTPLSESHYEVVRAAMLNAELV
jgi:4-hydroxy-tetrahydrodipicolinate synthase